MEAGGYTCMNGSARGSGSVSLGTSPTGESLATYTNERSNDYLTPASPVAPEPPKLPDFPPGFGQTRNQLLPRADSGIETDYPRSPLSSTSTSNPRVSTLYEYIDPKDVPLTERPHGLSSGSLQGESRSSGISSTETTRSAYSSPYSADAFDAQDGGRLSNGAKRRANPMYEALEKSATRLYAQTCHCKSQASSQKQLRYLWCAFIVLIVIAIFLLAVIAYMLFHLIPSLQSKHQTQEDKLKDMESNYAKFFSESNSLHQFASANSTNTGNVGEMIMKLNQSIAAVDLNVFDVTSRLEQQIQNISLTPGPQGPPGVGNLNSCYHRNVTSSIASTSPSGSTSWQPALDVLQDHIVMSAGCEVIDGTQQSLETNFITSNKVQYRCRCSGKVGESQLRSCRIHLLVCPRIPVFDTSVP